MKEMLCFDIEYETMRDCYIIGELESSYELAVVREDGESISTKVYKKDMFNKDYIIGCDKKNLMKNTDKYINNTINKRIANYASRIRNAKSEIISCNDSVNALIQEREDIKAVIANA